MEGPVRGVKRASAALETCDGALRLIEKAGVGIAGVLMFTIMLVVVANVTLRYFFNSPLSWSYELISLYLMVGLFFFALSDTLAANAHVSVNILHQYMPRRLRHACEFIGHALAIPVFAAIFYLSAVRTWESYRGADVIAGHIAWPTWLASICVPLGVGVLLLRMLLRVAGHGLSVLKKHSLIALPTMEGDEEAL